ncbi:MAG: ribosome biogenesis/translation initiation ATPase RLI [Candidatus Bathyarchaeia archaeon]
MGARVRVAIIDSEKCRYDKCSLECIRFCPMVRIRREAIRQGEDGRPIIVERLCSGCGICVQKCPFKAITIVNLPEELSGEEVYRFGPNAFALYRLPIPRRGTVSGLIGRNGMGKTTVLRVLAGEIIPNLGRFHDPPTPQEVVEHFAATRLQDYFRDLYEGQIRVVYKPQYVDRIPLVVSGVVGELLERVDERGQLSSMVDALELGEVLDREIGVLSGGELQRLAIATTLCREVDIYLFDEPSSHLDVYQRIQVARAIRGLVEEEKMVLVAEHDLAVLDYLSDTVFLLYGTPQAYGITSKIHVVREGINRYISGYIPDENVRFREKPIEFRIKPPTPLRAKVRTLLEWTDLEKTYDGFSLRVEDGEIGEGEVIGILGKNALGKTTFIKILAGLEGTDSGEVRPDGSTRVSYKPQYLTGTIRGNIGEALEEAAGEKELGGWFDSRVLKPLHVEDLLERDAGELSGGEIQRAAIAICLSRDAEIYLLDEPSAYLDVEERLAMARAIRRIVKDRDVTAFVVEHDIVAQDFIADRIMVFQGEPGRQAVGSKPLSLEEGMNGFLRDVGITFRRDPSTKRPRVNKEGSKLDREQKRSGQYYYL